MKNKRIIKIKDTVGYHLLKIVFSLYVIIAILITTLHMYNEYNNEKSKINHEMQNIEVMVKKQLTSSVWNVDMPLIENIINGILTSKSILGISIQTSDKILSRNFGSVDISKKNIYNSLIDKNNKVFFQEGLYSHTFELKDSDFNEGNSIGTITLYSGNTVIYSRIENNFLFIIINSIIKTFALWIIFLFFANKYLTKPFFEIIDKTNNIDYNNLDKIKFTHESINKNEFDILKNTFNQMFEKLNISNSQYKELNKDLEDIVKSRTIKLEESVEELKEAHKKLLHSEKMASLGSLVAGVAHEINTPVGIGLTGISHLEFLTEEVQEKYKEDNLSQEEFDEFLDKIHEVTSIVNKNLDRTASIIKNFKQVAVDQTSELERVFKVKDYILGVILSLNSIIKKKDISITVNCDESLEIISYPGFYSQILTNLIINTSIHGFKQKNKGNILIDVTTKDNILNLTFQDDGKGIPKENLPLIFDPFFSTNRDNGGTGLGLNIIYNIITSNLKGTVSCDSEVNKGTTFNISIPFNNTSKT